MSKMRKFWLIFWGVIILAFAGYFSFHFLFVFGDGVKAGQLNFVVRKGYIFKTYEGKLIQTGLQSKGPGSMGSNEFEFSITDKSIAEELMLAGGRYVELHYKEYLGALPWRGYSKYVVDKIVNIKEIPLQQDPNVTPKSTSPEELSL